MISASGIQRFTEDIYIIYNYGTDGGNESSFYANNSNTLYRIPLDGKNQNKSKSE